MQLQFEAAMSNGLGDAFTRKYIQIWIIDLDLGPHKMLPPVTYLGATLKYLRLMV